MESNYTKILIFYHLNGINRIVHLERGLFVGKLYSFDNYDLPNQGPFLETSIVSGSERFYVFVYF